MYERMLDKHTRPEAEEINSWMGKPACILFEVFDRNMEERYDIKRELKFPFGNNYGWGYKYSYKNFHLCYVFLEKGSFTVMIQIGADCLNKMQTFLPKCVEKTQQLWEDRYPCGNEGGGWIHYRVMQECEISDIIGLVGIKKKPNKL